ncbi:hypothetical protein ACLF3G_24730 [Falsiroseomonas sp. HC035]|uniref:hypothetical protein n=1 Tax=Falsiroseomonas sp. HC035 TaxID=3390999 RepID=UPI003D3168DF
MPQFAATIKHIKEGVKGFTISAAVKNIEGWEETLGKMEVTGAKTMVRDLERLKKLLQAEEIDGEAVKTVVAKLGKETVTMAGRSEGAKAEKIRELGEALNNAAA